MDGRGLPNAGRRKRPRACALLLAGAVLLGACGDSDSGSECGADCDIGGDGADSDVMPDAGDVGGGDPAADAARPDTCDFSGTWAVHRVSFATVESPLIPGPQKSSRWYFMHAAQQGDEVTLIRGLWCGDWTTGDATVRYSDDTFAALSPLARTDGRRGRYARTDDGCELELERIYWVFGVQDPEAFLDGVQSPPGRIDDNPEFSDLPPLPTAPDDAAVADVDDDGNPGVRSLLTDTPVGSGVRHGLQRGWEEIAGPTPRGADDFRVPAHYDFQEVALQATPELFQSGARVREGAPHEVRFVRVDADFAAADDLQTCEQVRELLPHRPTPRDAY
jgi:hypothetical protein